MKREVKVGERIKQARLLKCGVSIVLGCQIFFVMPSYAKSKDQEQLRLQVLTKQVRILEKQLKTVESQLGQLERQQSRRQPQQESRAKHYNVTPQTPSHVQHAHQQPIDKPVHHAVSYKSGHSNYCSKRSVHTAGYTMEPVHRYGSAKHYRRPPHAAFTEQVKRERAAAYRARHLPRHETYAKHSAHAEHSGKYFGDEPHHVAHKHLRPISVLDIGVPVYIASYMYNINPRFDIAALVINTSDVNRDRDLLIRRSNIEANLALKGFEQPKHPLLTISGEVQGAAFIQRSFKGPSQSNINLSAAKLDFLADINPYVLAFMTFAYDSTPAANGSRIANSRLFLDNGFITIGNLNTFPVYLTVGQVFAPFGRYNSLMISDPLPELIGETSGRGLILGYQHRGLSGLYASIFVMQGQTTIRGNSGRISQGGADLGFDLAVGKFTTETGVSYLANMADADGMQSTGGAGFGGFGATALTERLRHRVPAVAAYFLILYGHFTVLGQYITPTTSFSRQNLTFNDEGARPRAMHIEAAYTFPCFGDNCSIAGGYGESWQALGINLPRQRYMLTFSDEIMRSTVISFEYRHDMNYGRNDRATLQKLIAFNPKELDKTSDTLTGQVTVYF